MRTDSQQNQWDRVTYFGILFPTENSAIRRRRAHVLALLEDHLRFTALIILLASQVQSLAGDHESKDSTVQRKRLRRTIAVRLGRLRLAASRALSTLSFVMNSSCQYPIIYGALAFSLCVTL